MVFLPGEVVVDYSLRLKREFDRSRLWVNGYSNDVPCYIPSRRVLEEGGYEGAGAMVYYDRPTKFAPDVEERIIGAVHELMPKEFLAKPDQVSPAAAPPAIAYPDHSQLLVVRDAGGNERPVKTAADWAERVAHIRANMQQVMGPLPDTSRWAPLDVEVVSEEKTAKYLRRKVRFTPEVGDRVPAWLLIPNELPAERQGARHALPASDDEDRQGRARGSRRTAIAALRARAGRARLRLPRARIIRRSANTRTTSKSRARTTPAAR